MNGTTRTSLTLAVFVVGTLASLIVAATASAASVPTIESESASNITNTDATLEAQINLHEAPAGVYYQFQLVKEPGEYASEILCPTNPPPSGTDGCIGTHSASALPIGFLPGNSAEPSATQSASLDLSSAGVTLHPGTTYHYRVLVARRVQTEDTIEWEEPTVFGADQTFTTPTTGAPVIEGESVSHITPTDATLEAQIDTEGAETTYEFHLVTDPPCASGECLQRVFTLPSGKLLGSFVTQSVSLELNSAGVSLHPGERYEYWLTATNSDGGAGSQSKAQTFTASEESPSILSEGVSNITATDATLKAAIEPRAWHGAYYQLQLVTEPGEYASEILCPPTLQPGIDGCVGNQASGALPIGWVCGSCEREQAAQPVQLDLASFGVTLEPSTTYHFRVIAAKAVQTEDTIQWEPPTVFGADQTFTTPAEPPPLNAQTSGMGGQLTTVESPAAASPAHHRRHHRRHRRGLHRSRLHRASHL